MKAIRNILLVHRDDCTLNPLFKAILQQGAQADSVLSMAGLRVDSAEAEFPGTDLSEGEPLLPEVQSALDSLGFQEFKHRSKSIKLHPDLISWADLILVPDLGSEDIICTFSHEAWSKTIEIDRYCGNYTVIKAGFMPHECKTKEDYLSVARTFNTLVPDLINRVKDSYAYARIVKGIGMNKKTVMANIIITGHASVVKCGSDLMKFVKGNILVVDRLTALLRLDVDKDTAISTIKKFVERPEFYEDKLLETQDKVNVFEAKLHGNKIEPKVNKLFPDGDNAIEVVVGNAKALICSRGYHVDEVMGGHWKQIPYVSSCVGATQIIKDNQLIVVDAARGEVYDALLLQGG
jgi:phosphohistidine swiveling domain-containing protein